MARLRQASHTLDMRDLIIDLKSIGATTNAASHAEWAACILTAWILPLRFAGDFVPDCGRATGK